MTEHPKRQATPPKSIKAQRAEQREKKIQLHKKELKRLERRRRIAIFSAIAGVLVVIAVIAASLILAPKRAAYTAGGKGATISGVEKFTNIQKHVETAVTYKQTPPAGGEHNPKWLNCGSYTEEVPKEYAVHAQEHGAIWVTYDPKISKKELDTLKQDLPSTYYVLSPYKKLPAPIVISGWNVQLKVQKASDKRIKKFFEEYWKAGNAPENGAPCTGGVGEPGKGA